MKTIKDAPKKGEIELYARIDPVGERQSMLDGRKASSQEGMDETSERDMVFLSGQNTAANSNMKDFGERHTI